MPATKIFMSPSHDMINVCLVRGAVFAYVEAECVTWREGRKGCEQGPNLIQDSQVLITRLSRDQSEIY